MKNSWNHLRKVYVINTEKEREIGIGDEYKLEPIKFGECYNKDGYTYHNTIEHFKINYDYGTLLK